MNKLTIMALTGLILVALAAPVMAMGPLDVDASLDVNGKYVWRGMVATPDPVLQPAVGVGLFGFTLGLWGNIDTNDVNTVEGVTDTEWSFTEIDYTLGYELSLPMVNLGLGFINYTFPNSPLFSTTEFYLAASLGVPLSPSLTLYQDIDEIKGAYWEASISHGLALSPSMNLDLGAGVGLGSKSYIEGYFGTGSILESVPEVPGDAAMTDFYISAGMPFHPIPMFSITPSVTYSSLMGDVKDLTSATDAGLYHGKGDAFFWGLNMSFSF